MNAADNEDAMKAFRRSVLTASDLEGEHVWKHVLTAEGASTERDHRPEEEKEAVTAMSPPAAHTNSLSPSSRTS